MTDLSKETEYALFRHFNKTTVEIAEIKGITEHEADRRRLQQARDINAKFRTSRYPDRATEDQDAGTKGGV